MSKERTGVLLMAYGTPTNRDDILRYYTDIRRGRPPTPEQLAELTARYEAIGGLSPLRAITEEEARGLEALLNQRGLGRTFSVFVGMRHAPPFIADAVAAMAAAGLEEAVGLVLAPHYSAMSVGAYLELAEAALQKEGLPRRFAAVRDWHLAPGYIRFLAERVAQALAALPPRVQGRVDVVFTAHSLPERIRATGDPYPEAVAETAAAVAAELRLPHHRTGWQSAGRTPEPWLGPDILDVLQTVRDEGFQGVVVCPCGFVSDHLEILYDLDIEAARRAEELGLAFARTRMGNQDPAFLAVLADVVQAELPRLQEDGAR